jgi:hypothetical protein
VHISDAEAALDRLRGAVDAAEAADAERIKRLKDEEQVSRT